MATGDFIPNAGSIFTDRTNSGAPTGATTEFAAAMANGLRDAALDLRSALPYINVKNYGAVGDGTANDTTAIQNAITAASTSNLYDASYGNFIGGGGRTVFFPRGIYKITAGLTVPANGVRLLGEGRFSSTIKAAVGVAADAITFTAPTGQNSGSGMQGIGVMSPQPGGMRDGIHLGPFTTLTDVFVGMTDRYGVWVEQGFCSHLNNVRVVAPGTVGFYLTGKSTGDVDPGTTTNMTACYVTGYGCNDGFWIGGVDSFCLTNPCAEGIGPLGWKASTQYFTGQYVTNDTGKVYRAQTSGTSAGSGGPTGLGSSIVDGAVTWKYMVASYDYSAHAAIKLGTDPYNSNGPIVLTIINPHFETNRCWDISSDANKASRVFVHNMLSFNNPGAGDIATKGRVTPAAGLVNWNAIPYSGFYGCHSTDNATPGSLFVFNNAQNGDMNGQFNLGRISSASIKVGAAAAGTLTGFNGQIICWDVATGGMAIGGAWKQTGFANVT